MNIYEQQRDILFEACKKVATAPNCPKWIADILRTEVMRAKQIKEDFPSLSTDQETPQEDVPLEVGSVVVINNNGQSCVAKLVKETKKQGLIDQFVYGSISAGALSTPTFVIRQLVCFSPAIL